MIIVLAKAIPKDSKTKEKIIQSAKDLIKNSKNENGNIDYNLLTNTKDNTLLFVEQWETKEILEKHLQTPHFIKFNETITNLISSELEIKIFTAEETGL